MNAQPLTPRSVHRYKPLLHFILFCLTFFTTTLAGVGWVNKNPLELENFSFGLPYSLLLLTILTFHEFGHYYAAKYYSVKTTLPFYIPFPSFFGIFPFGTLGAVIIQRSATPSRKALFDFAAAGPLAGFIPSVIILAYGFLSLPSVEYLLQIHPDYFQSTTPPPQGTLTFGTTLLYEVFSKLFPAAGAFIPPMSEMYHYPFLCVGWFGLVITSFNLLPIGQLDGGRISFAMFGKRYHTIAQYTLVLMILAGLASFLPMIGIEFEYGWVGWLLWGFIFIGFIRFLGFERNFVEDDTPLSHSRRIIGWGCWVMFIISSSPVPIAITF